MHLLNFIADPNYRRHILKQLNRDEGRGELTRKVFRFFMASVENSDSSIGRIKRTS